MKRSSLNRLFVTGLCVVACCSAAVILYWKIRYPYGDRTALLRCMSFALLNYAQDHGGDFPKSEKGEYDAIQRLYPDYTPSGIELAGLSGDVKFVVRALHENVPLNSSLTSWRYWQGLNTNSNPDIAILWESHGGLYASGRRNFFGGHAVLFISGDITNVPATDWEGFVKRQEQLRTAVQMKQTGSTNAPPQSVR